MCKCNQGESSFESHTHTPNQRFYLKIVQSGQTEPEYYLHEKPLVWCVRF